MESFNDMLDIGDKISVGSYLAQRLAHAGTTHFFTVPGDFTLNLLDELIAEPRLKMVGCCNEMIAGYAADGYCRASGGLGAVVGNRSRQLEIKLYINFFCKSVTYMVGGLSVLNAVAGAYSEDLPLLVVSGGPNNNDMKEGHIIHHTIAERNLYQSVKCFEPVVARTFVIKNLRDAAGDC